MACSIVALSKEVKRKKTKKVMSEEKDLLCMGTCAPLDIACKRACVLARVNVPYMKEVGVFVGGESVKVAQKLLEHGKVRRAKFVIDESKKPKTNSRKKKVTLEAGCFRIDDVQRKPLSKAKKTVPCAPIGRDDLVAMYYNIHDRYYKQGKEKPTLDTKYFDKVIEQGVVWDLDAIEDLLRDKVECDLLYEGKDNSLWIHKHLLKHGKGIRR